MLKPAADAAPVFRSDENTSPSLTLREPAERPYVTVSEISEAVRSLLERDLRAVRVRGEISGLKIATSGHAYFTLKDSAAALDAVCWRGAAQACKAWLADGMEVIASGKMTAYGGRSKYQLTTESLEPAGQGARALLLERLKEKLRAEGLFDFSRKRPRPFLPSCVGVITSPSGAVIRDVLHRLRERFPCRVLLFPTLVQGEGSEEGILRAFASVSALVRAERAGSARFPAPDLVILARGGGSFEDLMTFNSEAVVRAVAACPVPVISGVGHETDLTLCDHAADLRAPTPTAAAEAAVPVRDELIRRTDELGMRLPRAALRVAGAKREALLRKISRMSATMEAGKAARSSRLRSLELRMASVLRVFLRKKRARFDSVPGALPPLTRLLDLKSRRYTAVTPRLAAALPSALAAKRRRLLSVPAAGQMAERAISERRYRLRLKAAPAAPALLSALRFFRERLNGLQRTAAGYSHHAVLGRGYALARQNGALLTSVSALRPDMPVIVEFADGASPPLFPSPSARKRKGGGGAADDAEQGSLF